MLKFLVLLLFHLCAVAAVCQVLLRKRDPRSALGWIALLLFLPIAGLVIYLIFGIGRAHSRAEKIMRRVAVISQRFLLIKNQILPDNLTTPEATLLDRLGYTLTEVPLCGGNHIVPLHNGDTAYPAMIEAINNAREHVFLGTYIFNAGHAADMFMEALEGAHKRGVDVRVLVDGIGQLYSWHKPVHILAKKGIKTTLFRPPSLIPPNFGINLRSHRKVLVCDSVGFTGGMNISDGNLLNYHPEARGKIQDVQFRCEGPIVEQLRRAFLMNWAFCSGEFTGLPPLPEKKKGDCDCRVVIDGPGDDGDALNDIICGAINIAQKTVLIMTPYFLPTLPLMAALQSAGQRGVDVKVILPGHNNLPYMSWATERILPHLIKNGVRVWRQAPPFAHSKLLAVDGFYSLIGSANMDSRSLLLNFELNMEIYNQAFHDSLVDFMTSTLRRGTEVTLKSLQELPLLSRLRNSACWIFSPYL